MEELNNVLRIMPQLYHFRLSKVIIFLIALLVNFVIIAS